MISIPLVYSQPYPCSYLEPEISRAAFVHPAFKMTTQLYSQLIQQGFRRSGNEVYAPRCQACTACIPVRVPVVDFMPNRSQQRCWQKNQDIQALVKPPEFNQEHYELYLRYQDVRHEEGTMADSKPDDYIGFLGSVWCDTVFVEFSIDGKLVAVAVVDRLEGAHSAVYTFFDPNYSNYSLGVYAILWEIEWAKSMQKEYVYLGFWIKACKKMSYKSNYQPLQVFSNNCWQPYSSC